MGGGGQSAPKPSKKEKALMQAQLDMLQQSRDEQELMKPFMLKSLGMIQEVQDGKTSYRMMTEEEKLAGMSTTERSNYDILKLQQDRQKLALEGKLPVSPALEDEIATQEKQLREGLSRRLGADYENSSAGIQALGEFQKKSGLLREEARRGEMSTGQGLMLSQQGYMQNENIANQNAMSGYGNRLFPLVQGYGSAMQPYQFNRSLQGQYDQMASQEKAAMYQGLGSLVGTGMGYGIGG